MIARLRTIIYELQGLESDAHRALDMMTQLEVQLGNLKRELTEIIQQLEAKE